MTDQTNEPQNGLRRKVLGGGAGLLALAGSGQVGRAQPPASTTFSDASLLDFVPESVRQALREGRWTGDTAPFLRQALASLRERGGTLWIPAGRYRLDSSISLPPRVRLTGAGSRASIFAIAHSSHGFRSEAPVNAATPVHVALLDLGITCLDNPTSQGAGFYDTGGTYVDLDRVLISGFKYGCIFDQTEIATVDRCQIEHGRAANIWLVNGPDLTQKAATTYTNRITITRCQIDQSDGYGIVDDGGRAHSYRDNNFNGCRKGHLRIAGFGEYFVEGNYFEGAGGPCLTISNTTLSGRNVQRPNVVWVNGNLVIAEAGQPAIACAGATVLGLYGNTLVGSGTSAIHGLNTIETLSSSGNAVRNQNSLFEDTRAFRQVSDELRIDHVATVRIPAIAAGTMHNLRIAVPQVRAGDMALASFEPIPQSLYALLPVAMTHALIVPVLNGGNGVAPPYEGLLRIKIFQA